MINTTNKTIRGRIIKYIIERKNKIYPLCGESILSFI
jgi:hypothetical protein